MNTYVDENIVVPPFKREMVEGHPGYRFVLTHSADAMSHVGLVQVKLQKKVWFFWMTVDSVSTNTSLHDVAVLAHSIQVRFKEDLVQTHFPQ